MGTRIAFERRITCSTNKTVTIKTKTEDGFLPIQLGEGFIQPFELQFQITNAGTLIRADDVTAEQCFPSGPETIQLVGVTKKATARLGEPHVIITEKWMPSAPPSVGASSDEDGEGEEGGGSNAAGVLLTELAKVQQEPFEPLQWLAHYLKTHSPKYEAHMLRKATCQAWLTKTGTHAAAKEMATEYLSKRGAAAQTREMARSWLLAKVIEADSANPED